MNILLGGDSWGVGEWGMKKEKYKVLHKSYDIFFKKSKHNFSNVSRGGLNNPESIHHVRKTMSVKNFDFVFWIQSSPLRNLRPYTTFREDYRSFNDLISVSKQLLDQDYKSLNDLGNPIYCLGGCSKLDLDIMSKYTNLIPIVPSITELILKDYIHPEIWFDEWNHLIGDQFDSDSINKLYKVQLHIDQLHQVEHYRKYFWPDGVHPNRHAHKILFEYLCKELNI